MRPCHVLRVFTRADEGGNHLGVVNDVTGLDDEGMQAIAADLGFSETIYIDWTAGGVPSVRIFTPASELPFAGHPLVGAAWTLSAMGPGTVRALSCGVGEIPCRVEEDGTTWVDTPLVSDVEPTDATEVATAAGLPTPRRSWWARMPLPYLVLELESDELVTSATPEIEALGPAGAPMTYLVGPIDDETLRVRFFAPVDGVPEDPATGSAAAAWAAVRAFEGEVAGSLTILQGDEIGHPSTIQLDWAPGRASLGGTVRRDEVRELDR